MNPESAEGGPNLERVITVAPERLGRWLTGFEERHGALSAAENAGQVITVGSDGARAVITVPFPPLPPGDDLISALLDHVSRERRVGALLVRKGGHGVGIFKGRQLITSKVGSSYVQGGTTPGAGRSTGSPGVGKIRRRRLTWPPRMRPQPSCCRRLAT